MTPKAKKIVKITAIAVITNLEKWVYSGVKFRLVMNSRSAVYTTDECGGIIA